MRQMNIFEFTNNDGINYENILNAKSIKIVDENFIAMNYRNKKNVANFTHPRYGDMLIFTENKIKKFLCEEDGKFISISGISLFDNSNYGFGSPLSLNNFKSDLENLLKYYKIKEVK